MPYLSKSRLLKVQDSKTYVFMPHDLKVEDSPNCLKVLKYGIQSCKLKFKAFFSRNLKLPLHFN
jgi:hypothetical protein